MDKLIQGHGNWVTGDRFWDREEDIALFVKRIQEGAHLLLVAQRRMGKTSLMKEVAARLAEEFECVFVDFQDGANPQDAIAALSLALHSHKSLWNHVCDLFSNILGKIEKIGPRDLGVTLRAGLTDGNWRSRGDELFTILAKSEKPVLLLLDEVPILVNQILKGEDYAITAERRRMANDFMSWLRKNSLEHQGKVRIVVSGSIGFEPVLHQAGLSATINNFTPFELKPWSDATAIGCLRALAKGYDLKYRAGAEAEMVRLLGCCIPHHVQMFFTHAEEYCRRRKDTTLRPEDVAHVYHTEMLSTRGHAELTHYEDRLKLVLGPERMPFALDMLTEAAVSGHLTGEAICRLQKDYAFTDGSAAEVQREILQILEHDGYLVQADNGYRFVSQLLRDWWKSRYQMFFTPVAERGE